MLTENEKERLYQVDKILFNYPIFNRTAEQDKERNNLVAERDELYSKMNLICLGDYLKLENKPKIRHLSDAGLARNLDISYVTRDYWTVTFPGGNQRSWCNHGGTMVEIVED